MVTPFSLIYVMTNIVVDNKDMNPHLKHYNDIKDISYIKHQTYHTSIVYCAHKYILLSPFSLNMEYDM